MSIKSLFPCSFLFSLHLEWSLNTSDDKKSNAVCIFACHFSLWFKLNIFFSLLLFSVEIHKRTGKKLTGKKINLDRQFFKYVICILIYFTLCNLIAEAEQYQFLGKIATHFTHFHLLTPLPLK